MVQDGGIFKVRTPSGPFPAIQLAGKPVTSFQEGWTPKRVYVAFAPAFVLELAHVSGHESIWWLDASMNHISTSAEHLPQPLLSQALSRVNSLVHRLWREVFVDPAIHLSGAVADFLMASPALRLDVARLWLAHADGKSHVVNLSKHESAIETVVPSTMAIDTDQLQRALAINHQELIFSAASDLCFRSPSIFGKHEVTSVHSICLDTFRFVYRYIDAKYGRVFYTCATGHHCVMAGIIAVDDDDAYCFCLDGNQQALLEGILFDNARKNLIVHCCTYGALFVDYLSTRPAQAANVLRCENRHMGHMLWNELTGLQGLVARVSPEDVPDILIPDAGSGGELYGPLDAIFPETAGRVVRTISNSDEFIATAYRTPYLVFRATNLFVEEDLRRRIMAFANDADLSERILQKYNELATVSWPMFTLGLRVENRTAADMNQFCGAVVDCVLGRTGKTVVIVDGHNATSVSSPRSLVTSNHEWTANRPPVDVEYEVVAYLKNRFPPDKVVVVSLIGTSVSESVFWISKSRFFVAPWGTGMAKYSWICNIPGFVVTTEWNINNRGDIGIYGEPYNRGAATLRWADKKAVVAAPDAPVLVAVSDWPRQSYENFVLDETEFRNQLSEFIDELDVC